MDNFTRIGTVIGAVFFTALACLIVYASPAVSHYAKAFLMLYALAQR